MIFLKEIEILKYFLSYLQADKIKVLLRIKFKVQSHLPITQLNKLLLIMTTYFSQKIRKTTDY